MNCVDCKDFTCQHRSESTGGGSCYYESGEQKEKLLTMAAEASLHSVDWSSFRREAAKDILCAMLGRVERFYTGVSIDGKNKISHHKDFIKLAIEDADELIKQLKEEKK